MSDPVRRAVRTVAQVAAAAAVGLPTLVGVDVITAVQAAKVAALLTFLAGLITLGMNAFEDNGAIPSLGKHPRLSRPAKRTPRKKV